MILTIILKVNDMARKTTKLEFAQQQVEKTINKTNIKIEELGQYTESLYEALKDIQLLFDRIRNIPEENRIKYEGLKKIQLDWKQQAENIALEYKKAEDKVAGKGVAGLGAGVAVVTMGPTAAMGIATTFGVASTGTAISTLSGAAATNAALAWLGGGALAAGGGGIAAGNAFLALAGPIGWTIAGVSLLVSGLIIFKSRKDKQRLEDIYTLISIRDTKSYELAIVELNERIERIKDETNNLKSASLEIKSFGVDYSQMTEDQQYELGSYVNLMEASTMLLINPILGLQPKYTKQHFEQLINSKHSTMLDIEYLKAHSDMVISLCNLLYKIDLDEKDKKLLTKSLRNNKEFLQSVEISKKELDGEALLLVEKALEYRYSTSSYQ